MGCTTCFCWDNSFAAISSVEVFLIYWQLCGSLQSFHRQVVECQDGKGLSDGNRKLKRNVVWFNVIIFMEVFIISLYSILYYVESNQAEFVMKQSKMFYFPQLRIVNSFVTLYTYIAWNVSMFIYIMYTDAAYLEVKHYNDNLKKLDGSSCNIESTLLSEMDVYGKICDVVRELDAIFRLYAFIMLAIIIPSVIFTLMMLNQRIHGFKDLIICSPSIALCIYSFLAVTLAPARLHDECCGFWLQHMHSLITDRGIKAHPSSSVTYEWEIQEGSDDPKKITVRVTIAYGAKSPHTSTEEETNINAEVYLGKVSRSRTCLIRNESIWFPYRKDVFMIAQALSSHMQQHDLGISIWGFAILSRPLILAVIFTTS
ncbi:hypothetical protein GCK32_002529 [Trichostrongylus colubriformis]|uniref:Gustatory receptor n=1 Tax=Trichostrongylus colubriformis TaxID=6319 RepID=A0AAN8F6A8_TRICO